MSFSAIWAVLSVSGSLLLRFIPIRVLGFAPSWPALVPPQSVFVTRRTRALLTTDRSDDVSPNSFVSRRAPWEPTNEPSNGNSEPNGPLVVSAPLRAGSRDGPTVGPLGMVGEGRVGIMRGRWTLDDRLIPACGAEPQTCWWITALTRQS